MDTADTSRKVREEALRLGFSACGFAQAAPAAVEALFFDRWIQDGCQAGMAYMENHRTVRLNPQELVEGARTVVSVALNYYPARKQEAGVPQIAYYAYGKDYHKVIKRKLRALEAFLTSLFPGQRSRSFVDSAPLLERYWAWKAGLGWIGKNTCLIVPPGETDGAGSFFFLGEVVTTAGLSPDTPMADRCGACTRCLDACPTGTLERPKRLDANKCLSYLTIEHRGAIPEEYAAHLGNRLFGCDTCQQVCPWNRFAVATGEAAFSPGEAMLSLQKEDVFSLSENDYSRIFEGSAVDRAGYEGLKRTINYLRMFRK